MRIDLKAHGATLRGTLRRALIIVITLAVAAAGFFVERGPAHADTVGTCTFPTSPTPTVFARLSRHGPLEPDLANVDLSYGDFTNTNFDGAKFQATQMDSIHMSGTSFRGAQFSGSLDGGVPLDHITTDTYELH